MTKNYDEIVALVRDTLVEAGSTFRPDKKEAYRSAIGKETSERAKWMLETILENAEAAEKHHSPLCDDSGIPHMILEVGEDCPVTGRTLDAIREGVAEGLRKWGSSAVKALGIQAEHTLKPMDAVFVRKNFPVPSDPLEDRAWEGCTGRRAPELMRSCVLDRIAESEVN